MKKCPKCAEQVQDDASACRFCGHKFGFQMPKLGCGTVGVIALVVLYIIGRSNEPTPTSLSGPPINVTAKDFIAEYQANEVAAKAKYNGRPVQITGYVKSVVLNLTNDAVLNMIPFSDGGAIATLTLQDAYKQRASSLVPGQQVTVTCGSTDQLVGIPVALECQL